MRSRTVARWRGRAAARYRAHSRAGSRRRPSSPTRPRWRRRSPGPSRPGWWHALPPSARSTPARRKAGGRASGPAPARAPPAGRQRSDRGRCRWVRRRPMRPTGWLPPGGWVGGRAPPPVFLLRRSTSAEATTSVEVFRRPAVGRLDDIWGKAGRGYTDAVPSARRLTVVRQSKSSSSSSIGSHPGLGWRRRLVDRDGGAFALLARLLALSAVIS